MNPRRRPFLGGLSLVGGSGAALALLGGSASAIRAKDIIVQPSAAGDIVRAIGRKVVEYPDVGHIPFMEATARFGADLAAIAG